MTAPIFPCLWFDGRAAEAAELYCSIFRNSSILDQNPLVVMFSIDGQQFMALNGGPDYYPNPTISFYVTCETYEELDNAWQKLSKSGTVMMPLDRYEWSERYGWVQDAYGISWQLTIGKIDEVGQKVSPMMMFTGPNHGKAEEAMIYYTNVFPDSAIQFIDRYSAVDEGVEGNIKHGRFRIGDTVLMAMDSHIQNDFNFTEGISLVVECDNQEEIDYFWDELTKEGEESMCGWLKDRYGVSWQIVPGILRKLMEEPERGQRVINAFLKMRKFDIETLLKA